MKENTYLHKGLSQDLPWQKRELKLPENQITTTLKPDPSAIGQ